MDFEIFALLCIFLLDGSLSSVRAEKHSLYYIYTALSKPVDLPGIYEFTAMGLLDDRQIDYYNSEEKRNIPKQTWMKEKMETGEWEKGTQSRKSKEQWFNVNVIILMDRMRHNQSDPPDVHVFSRKSSQESKLNLTCLATGFYPKNVMMFIRQYRTSENETQSTGIRPNHDGSFQMRKSVEIKEEDIDEYECYVTYSSLKEPVVKKWDRQNQSWKEAVIEALKGAGIGGFIILAISALVFYVLKKIHFIDLVYRR